MSNIVLVAGANHEKLRKFFSDRGTMDHIKSYESIHGNENNLLMGTYEVDKLIYVNQFEDMNVEKDMLALYKILRSSDSFFSTDEVVIFSLEDESGDSKYYDILKVNLSKDALTSDLIKVPKFIVKSLGKPLSFDQIYMEVLGTSGIIKDKVTYRTIYRAERNTQKDELYEKSASGNMIPMDFREWEDFTRISKTLAETGSKDLFKDIDRPEREFMDLNLHHFSYSELKKSKLLYFIGDRRVGNTTNLLSVAISLLLTNKSVLIIDLSDNRDIKGILKGNSIPYNEFNIKDLVTGRVNPKENHINIIQSFGVSSDHFVKWMQASSLDTKTDFILVDLPYRLKDVLRGTNETVIRTEEMEENNLRRFESVTGRDIVILTSLFEVDRSCNDDVAKECLSQGVSKIIAPMELKVSDVKPDLAIEVLKEG